MAESKSRSLVLEALATFPNGCSRDEIVDLIGRDIDQSANPNSVVGATLVRLEIDNLVEKRQGKFYLTGSNGHVASNGTKVHEAGPREQVAPFMGKRKGKTVTFYTSSEYNNVISIALLINQKWIRVPMWADAFRVHIGNSQPKWTPEQETYSDVELVKMKHQDGQTTEKRPEHNDLVTIAPDDAS